MRQVINRGLFNLMLAEHAGGIQEIVYNAVLDEGTCRQCGYMVCTGWRERCSRLPRPMPAMQARDDDGLLVG